jgi:hypothetical protein
VTTDLDADLFDAAEPEPLYGVRAGRYRFPPPPGVAPSPRGWMRMTNLISAFSDQEKLQLWLTWKAFEGLRAHDVIFDEWMAEPLERMTDQERSALANLYAEKCRAAAKADEAARRGTARHTMVEAWATTGERTGTRSMQAQLDSYAEALEKADLEILESEVTIWHPAAGGTMGRADARVMCRRTGQTGILDLKTQARFWTWQEICGQLYGYDSAPWQWSGPEDERGCWRPGTPGWSLLGRPGSRLAGQPVALVAHMPQAPGPGQLPVTIKQIPMAYGKDVLECAARNVELRSLGRSVNPDRMPVEDFPC